MTKSEILEKLTGVFRYREGDDTYNLDIIKSWINTDVGFEEYRDYVRHTISRTASSKELNRAAKELTIDSFIGEMIEFGGVERVMDDLREQADTIWQMVLLNLKSKHERVYHALEGSREFKARLDDNKLLVYGRGDELLETHDMGSIWEQILQNARRWDYDWMETDITTVAGIVK